MIITAVRKGCTPYEAIHRIVSDEGYGCNSLVSNAMPSGSKVAFL